MAEGIGDSRTRRTAEVNEYIDGMRQEAMLQHHLQYNHYPPIHSSFVAVAKEAIDKVNAEEYDAIIKMPNDKSLTSAEIVEGLHLECFLKGGN